MNITATLISIGLDLDAVDADYCSIAMDGERPSVHVHRETFERLTDMASEPPRQGRLPPFLRLAISIDDADYWTALSWGDMTPEQREYMLQGDA